MRAEPSSSRDMARYIIEYDSSDVSTHAPHSLPMSALMDATSRNPIPWPKSKAPTPKPLSSKPKPNAPLPQMDYVVVTWTVEEARCLADTLTPGYASKTDWYPYAHKFTSDYVPIIRKGAPALYSQRLGSWFPTVIAGKRVACFKSELHMSQDGPKLPIAMLWQQIIEEARPKLIITTGTAGGIGPNIELGDVALAAKVRFDCKRTFKSRPFATTAYPCSTVRTTSLHSAASLFKANADHLPSASRPPQIWRSKTAKVPVPDVVTTDFFAFDDTSNTFALQGLGAAVEMGDAVLGMVIEQLGSKAPKWAAVRNASDPEIDSNGLTEKEAATKAAQIYEKFGYWTTIPSAITCWALILDN
jgi:purine-nucleoside phosphorylase